MYLSGYGEFINAMFNVPVKKNEIDMLTRSKVVSIFHLF